MTFIDLKIFSRICQSPSSVLKEVTNEFWENNLRPIDGLHTRIRIPKVRRSIQRQSQSHQLFLLGPLSMYGFRPTHLYCHREESLEARSKSLHNFTGSECFSFRKSTNFTGVFKYHLHKPWLSPHQPIEFIWLTLGQRWDEIDLKNSHPTIQLKRCSL